MEAGDPPVAVEVAVTVDVGAMVSTLATDPTLVITVLPLLERKLLPSVKVPPVTETTPVPMVVVPV